MDSAEFLLTVGGILLLGLLTTTLSEKTFLPRITFLLLFGILIGPHVLDLIPPLFTARFELIAEMTLLMVGFLLGGKLNKKTLKGAASEVLWISLMAVLGTVLIVFAALVIFGVEPAIALVLGCIASATAPAAILDVVRQTGANSRFSLLLLSIVALDDIWALLLFALALAIVGTLNGDAGSFQFLLRSGWEFGGAVLTGIALGLPAAFLTGRIKKGEPILIEALAIVFLCGGIALWLNVSYLIAAMVMGALIANIARHHSYPFHAIEGIESLFMVIFFVLAGASLELYLLQDIGLMAIIYIAARILGKLSGAFVGASIGCSAPVVKRWMGCALMPQAGVAIGMALVASGVFPDHRQLLLSVVISATILFELFGPILTRIAIRESHKKG